MSSFFVGKGSEVEFKNKKELHIKPCNIRNFEAKSKKNLENVWVKRCAFCVSRFVLRVLGVSPTLF
jgi:hypothetical protein